MNCYVLLLAVPVPLSVRCQTLHHKRPRSPDTNSVKFLFDLYLYPCNIIGTTGFLLSTVELL